MKCICVCYFACSQGVVGGDNSEAQYQETMSSKNGRNAEVESSEDDTRSKKLTESTSSLSKPLDIPNPNRQRHASDGGVAKTSGNPTYLIYTSKKILWV